MFGPNPPVRPALLAEWFVDGSLLNGPWILGYEQKWLPIISVIFKNVFYHLGAANIQLVS